MTRRATSSPPFRIGATRAIGPSRSSSNTCAVRSERAVRPPRTAARRARADRVVAGAARAHGVCRPARRAHAARAGRVRRDAEGAVLAAGRERRPTRELFVRFSSDANEVDLQDFVRRLFSRREHERWDRRRGALHARGRADAADLRPQRPGARCDVIDARTSFVAQPRPRRSPVPKHVRLGDFMFADNTRSVTRGPSHETPAPRKHAWTAPSNGFQPASSDMRRARVEPRDAYARAGRADGRSSCSWSC